LRKEKRSRPLCFAPAAAAECLMMTVMNKKAWHVTDKDLYWGLFRDEKVRLAPKHRTNDYEF
jgi:hypothetical protein